MGTGTQRTPKQGMGRSDETATLHPGDGVLLDLAAQGDIGDQVVGGERSGSRPLKVVDLCRPPGPLDCRRAGTNGGGHRPRLERCRGECIGADRPTTNNSGCQCSTVPVGVSGLTGAIAIAAGYAHTSALITGGTVQCWGSNIYGQLGNGTNTYYSNVSVSVSGL